MSVNSQQYIVEELKKRWPSVPPEIIETAMEVPKDRKLGDLAFPCFRLAKELRKAPPLIAQELAAQLGTDEVIEKAQAVGPYVNMFVNKTWLASYVLGQIEKTSAEGRVYGSSLEGEGKTIVLDYSSINVAKPFHIGHLRTTVIGNSISRILKFMGYKRGKGPEGRHPLSGFPLCALPRRSGQGSFPQRRSPGRLYGHGAWR